MPSDMPSALSERESNVEYHDDEAPAVCVGQWCCGCTAHPIGKPWGWNHEAWDCHHVEAHGGAARA